MPSQLYTLITTMI